ncbi:hypothetical protein EVA_22307, partial [gut metagenome]
MKTKVAIKNQNITAFGGIFQVEDLFNRRFYQTDRLISRSE